MLAPGTAVLSRRGLLTAISTLVVTACGRITQRPQPQAPPPTPIQFDTWSNEARNILQDALETLQTFETYAAFRLSLADQTDKRSEYDLAWDPPATVAWNEATHVARGLHGRAEKLFKSVTATQLDPGVWREQRDMSEWTHDLQDLGDELDAYRTRVDRLAPNSDGTAMWDLLDRAWARWDASAGHWGLSRAEQIACATPS